MRQTVLKKKKAVSNSSFISELAASNGLFFTVHTGT